MVPWRLPPTPPQYMMPLYSRTRTTEISPAWLHAASSLSCLEWCCRCLSATAACTGCKHTHAYSQHNGSNQAVHACLLQPQHCIRRNALNNKVHCSRVAYNTFLPCIIKQAGKACSWCTTILCYSQSLTWLPQDVASTVLPELATIQMCWCHMLNGMCTMG